MLATLAGIFDGWHHDHVSTDGGSGIHGLVQLVKEIVIVGAILWLLWWLVDQFIPAAAPGSPGLPFNKIAKGIIAFVGVIFLINILLSLL